MQVIRFDSPTFQEELSPLLKRSSFNPDIDKSVAAIIADVKVRGDKALCDYACRLHLHQLYAIIAATNKPATRLFKLLAFDASAVLHDWLRSEENYVDAIVWQKIIA